MRSSLSYNHSHHVYLSHHSAAALPAWVEIPLYHFDHEVSSYTNLSENSSFPAPVHFHVDFRTFSLDGGGHWVKLVSPEADAVDNESCGREGTLCLYCKSSRRYRADGKDVRMGVADRQNLFPSPLSI